MAKLWARLSEVPVRTARWLWRGSQNVNLVHGRLRHAPAQHYLQNSLLKMCLTFEVLVSEGSFCLGILLHKETLCGWLRPAVWCGAVVPQRQDWSSLACFALVLAPLHSQ